MALAVVGAYNEALWQLLAKKLPHFSWTLTQKEIGIVLVGLKPVPLHGRAPTNITGLSGNLPAVTGAAGKRILGGIFQAVIKPRMIEVTATGRGGIGALMIKREPSKPST